MIETTAPAYIQAPQGLKAAAKWFGRQDALQHTLSGIEAHLRKLHAPLYVVRTPEGIGLADSLGGAQAGELASGELLASLPALQGSQLGSEAFRQAYGLRYSYMGGAMANGIASEELVIALGKAGMLCSFGAGGLVPARIEAAIDRIQAALPQGPYAFNLIHSPNEEALERRAVELFLSKGVHVIEASAFMDLTVHVVRFRASGLSRNADGSIRIDNRVIAKVSRLEVAEKFMRPAPERLLQQLLAEGKITPLQAELAAQVPMADDVTAEADSGGHTDNRALVCLLPAILQLRDQLQAQYQFPTPVRVGAGGGIGTPASALAAFSMGADYLVTGSVNQACRESGTSDHVRKVLAQADMADVMMAPASDMFELGVKLQVLKKGTMFPLRAQKLYDIYNNYESWADVPEKVRQQLEGTLLKSTYEQIWQGCIEFFQARDPEVLVRAQGNPKRQMALVFRWYLGLSSSWANRGEKGRELDYQIWCGPAMGAFNQWTKGTYLEQWENRYAADVALQLLQGAAYLYRLQNLRLLGLQLHPSLQQFTPRQQG